MTSFNHYTLGSVAGIAPATPGYKEITINPHPIPGLEWAKGRFDSPYGPIESSWERQDENLTIDILVPPNTTATVHLPGKEPLHVGSGQYSWQIPLEPEPASKPIALSTELSDIMDDEVAYKTILAAFYSVSDFVGNEFQTRTKWLPNQLLSSSVGSVAPAVKGTIEKAIEAFNVGTQG